MKPPLFVRPLTDAEREALTAGLRSPDAVTLRRCQILRASARGERPAAIARSLGCSDQTVRNVIHAFHRHGLGALAPGSSRPHTIHAAFDAARAERLRQVLHRRPSEYGKPTEVWTLEVAAEVAFELGLPPNRVSGETVRATLARLGGGWRRAKRWITSPDPQYAQKTATGTV
jgi:transposase